MTIHPTLGIIQDDDDDSGLCPACGRPLIQGECPLCALEQPAPAPAPSQIGQTFDPDETMPSELPAPKPKSFRRELSRLTRSAIARTLRSLADKLSG